MRGRSEIHRERASVFLLTVKEIEGASERESLEDRKLETGKSSKRRRKKKEGEKSERVKAKVKKRGKED